MFIIWPRKPETIERMVKALYLLLESSLRMSLLGAPGRETQPRTVLVVPRLVPNRANSILPRQVQLYHMAFRTSYHYCTEIIHLYRGMWAKMFISCL